MAFPQIFRARSHWHLPLSLLAGTAALSACGGNESTASPPPACFSDCGGSSGSGRTTVSAGAGATGGASSASTGSGGTATGSGGTGSMQPSTGGGVTSGAGGAPVPDFTLVVDLPTNNATVSGSVVVSGHAPAFKNVEAWDAAHQKPPLGSATPGADGAFSFTVDATKLTPGPTTWTVYAWDTPPGVASTRSANVPLSLTIGDGSSTGSGGASGSAGATGSGGSVGNETVGTGSTDAPAVGPAPTDAAKIGGGKFTLVKNWDFGASGTIRDISSLSSEFQYHDQFGTIGNGSNYGAITVAPNSATAISGQPVEDPSRPYREFTPDTMKTYVRPLSASQANVSVSQHNAGNGSITAKWTLSSGGALLGKDLLWETRVRMPAAAAAYWFAIWTAGNKWDKGAEMDVLESFGTPNIYPPPAAFHVNSVGGSDKVNYSSWPSGLTSAGVPQNDRDLTNWHVFTWLYRADDSYVVYFDGIAVQDGTLHWTLGGSQSGEHINMSFLFDFGWGHTQISDVNITLPASGFNITYEVDYSRVYLR